MSIDIHPAWAMSIYLVSLRLGVLLLLNPIFSGFSKPVTVRVLFTLALATLLVSGSDASFFAPPWTIVSVIVASLSELWVGATLALGVFLAFGSFAIAGKIVDIQSGLGIGSVFDPVTRSGSPLFSTLLNLAAVAVFFGLDGHHALLRGIEFSLQQIPPGSGFSALSLEATIRQFGLMFSLGVALIAPVMFCLFLVEVGLAIVSRALPQLNVFIIGMPAKIFISIAMLALTLPTLSQVMGHIYASIFTYWNLVLQS